MEEKNKAIDVEGEVVVETGSAPNGGFTTEEGAAIFGESSTEGEYVLTICDHANQGACATVCKLCGTELETDEPHTYDTVNTSCDDECNVCGETREVTHNYNKNGISDTHHWKECVCGAQTGNEVHSGGEATCVSGKICAGCEKEYTDKNLSNHAPAADWSKDENTHWKDCGNGCGKKLDEAEHKSEVWKNDGTYHWKECVDCGGVFAKGECSGGTPDCMNKAKCTTCGLGHGTTDATTHVGDSDDKWDNDGTKHWQICDCGETINERNCSGGTADCMNKAVCTTCKLKYGELDDDNHGADESEWLSDGTKHWYKCKNGCSYRFDEDECEGSAATCVAKGVCDTCDNEYGEIDRDAHAPSEWINDGEQHWKECGNGCGKILESGECAGGEVTCFEKAVCDTCEQEYGKTLRHVSDYKYVNENGKHFKVCISGCGTRYDEEECYGGKASCTEKARCEVCGSEYGEIAPNNHIPSVDMKKNETHHWYECINCKTELGKGAHSGKASCVSAAICYECGAEHGEINANAHKASGSWSSDENGHWQECANGCGTKLSYASHSGGSASCTAKANCSVCGRAYGEVKAHSYSESWTVYGNKHWHECECGAKSEEAEHSFGEWSVTKEATATEGGIRESVCICGEKLTQVIPVISKPKAKSTLPPTAIAAIALGATAVAGAGGAAVTTVLTAKKKRKK